MSKLKRFPNPGSDINMIIEIFRRTYGTLSLKKYFSLYDMELAMINNYLVSSEGFTGMKAFELSLREDASRDPIYNQAKMYAELYRMLGWYSSSKDKNLIFTITELGRYVAESNVANELIFRECIMGMADENEVIRIKEDENSGVEWIDIDKAEEITNEEKMKQIYKKLNNKIKDYNL